MFHVVVDQNPVSIPGTSYIGRLFSCLKAFQNLFFMAWKKLGIIVKKAFTFRTLTAKPLALSISETTKFWTMNFLLTSSRSSFACNLHCLFVFTWAVCPKNVRVLRFRLVNFNIFQCEQLGQFLGTVLTARVWPTHPYH